MLCRGGAFQAKKWFDKFQYYPPNRDNCSIASGAYWPIGCSSRHLNEVGQVVIAPIRFHPHVKEEARLHLGVTFSLPRRMGLEHETKDCNYSGAPGDGERLAHKDRRQSGQHGMSLLAHGREVAADAAKSGRSQLAAKRTRDLM